MKKLYTLITLVFLSQNIFAQCPTVGISRDAWTIEAFDSEETNGEGPNNGHAIHAIDGNSLTFWHSQWQDVTASFPHFIAIDMGAEYDISKILVRPRSDSQNNRPKAYELYLSTDGISWDPIQAAGDLNYSSELPGAYADFDFYPVTARYFKLIFNSAYDGGNHVAISEIIAFEVDGLPGCAPTGQDNQIITFETIPQQYTTNPDIELVASTNTGLPLIFEVNSGPASINGNTLHLLGDGGTVTVTAHSVGDEDYYPAYATQTFEVVDLNMVVPEVFTGLTEDLPIQMPQLMPYRLYANAQTAESEMLDIANITFEVDGQLLESLDNDGYFLAWWTPSSYGEHTIVITAISSNGMEAQIERNVVVTDQIETNSVVTLEDAVIDFGTIGSQWYYGTYDLPQSVGSYEQIVANFAVSCPSVPGGCDDWDRLAYIQIKDKSGKWIELFRYITPYGVACDHSIDVTDYASLLQGEVEFRVYIETWGSGGWKMDLNIEYIAGEPLYIYTTVEEVWQGTYNFGDPENLQPVPIFEVDAPANTEQAIFRLVTTGHGWGENNTGNAAEFYYTEHNLQVNGSTVFTQEMEVDCDPNPDGCTGQQGTWFYNRAGWCPGTIPAPYFYNLTEFIDSPFEFRYEFQPGYTDQCHPNNPYCVSGVTCPDCNDGYNPHYRVGGYIISLLNG